MRRFARYIAFWIWLRRAVNDRPYKRTRFFRAFVISRAGLAPPLPRNDFYCPVGRGDPTPPWKFAVVAKLQGGVKTPPYKQPEGKVQLGKIQIPGRFVGNGLDRSVRFSRYIVISGYSTFIIICPRGGSTLSKLLTLNSPLSQRGVLCPPPTSTPIPPGNL